MVEENPPASVEFHYIKSNSFRVVHADGVWGGTTPRGYIAMSLFSERAPIPRKLIHEIMPDGILGQETGRESRDGIIREVEVEVKVDLEMAKSLIQWLQGHVDFLEERRAPERKGD